MTTIALHKYALPVKRLLPPALWQPFHAIATALITPVRFSTSTGHWASSMRALACTRRGEPLPWYSYPAIDFLTPRDFKDKSVLEFGGGQSTLWWQARARSVVTIEEDAGWCDKLRGAIANNVTLHHAPIDHATRSVAQIRGILDSIPGRKFDVIVVDGHLRQELAALSFDYLAGNGALILDDAEGYGFHEEIRNRDCRRIDFFGFAPGAVLRHCTSIVYVSDCFLLKPEIPLPAIELTRP